MKFIINFRKLALTLIFGLFLCVFLGCSDSAHSPLTENEVSLPRAPNNLIADAGKERATLRWSPVTDADTFTIYYSALPGLTKNNSNRVEDRHTPHLQRDLENNTTYFFAVASVNANGEGPLSKEVSATPSAAPPPYAPSDVVAKSGVGQVQLTWAPSKNATGYTIYYDTEPGVDPETGIQLLDVESPHAIEPLALKTTYYFVITASNANGESTASFEVSAVPLDDPPPSPPETVSADQGDGQMLVAWSGVDDADVYNVYYATEFYLTKDTATKLSGVASPLTIGGLTNKTAYFAFVTAQNQNGESARSKTISATPLAQPPVHKMMEIPGGPFQRGNSNDHDPVDQYFLPVHEVHLDTFYIDRYETTYDLWQQIFEWAIENDYEFDHSGQRGTMDIGTNMPATGINWFDAVKWLNARSEYEGRTPVYYTDTFHSGVYRKGQVDLTNAMVDWDANGYRLPTGAEREKAARGGLKGKRFPWGDDLGGTSNANHNKGMAVSVGLYAPNGYGLYDMAGNIWEWVWDRESDNYEWALGMDNPRGPDEGEMRVRRSGAYTYGARYLQCHERMFRLKTYNAPYFGFRTASSAAP